jgi:hypothetical protein
MKLQTIPQQNMIPFTLQAMKVCVGEKKFDEAVIGQEKINAQVQLALSEAHVELARGIALAKFYAENPIYVTLQIALANAQAIKETDKLIFTPDGVFPNLIFNN